MVHPFSKVASQEKPPIPCLGMKSTRRKPMKLPPYVASMLKPYNLCLPSSPLIDLKAAMSDQPPSSPPQPQPFRFWLPYRSNVSLSRQQPRPMPASPRPQPPPPPPTPAEPAPRPSPVRAVEEDILIQVGSSSEESDTIPVQALDSLRLRGARPSMADLELTLSRSPPPTGQEQGTRRDGDRGNDTKISISGFPRARLFDGARAPYRREIEDSLKSLAGRETPAPRPPDSGNQGYRVITLSGHNVGASMVLGSGPRDAPLPKAASEPEGSARPAAVAANVNSNVQSVNNSAMEGSTCNAGDPGVHVDIKNAHEKPVVQAPTKEEEKPARAPPPGVNGTAASAVEASARTPPRTRRCLRALMLETRKPRPTACRFQCVADHPPPPPPATASDGGKTAEEGAGESTR